MINSKEKNLFRLSALLYKDENYNTKRDTTLKKIIESIFIENNNPRTVTEVIEYSDTNYSLILESEEIERIVRSNLNKSFLIKDMNEDELTFLLTDKRYNTIKKFRTLGVDSLICEFIKEKGLEEKEDVVKNLLYAFFYDVFTSNYDAYHCILTNSFSSIRISDEGYSNEEKELINSFLNYDNPEKDKAIFNLVNLALEYCMLTGDGKSFRISSMSNKIFYLDTNIIYRAIGVNGEKRKDLTLKFLNICKKNFIQLKITPYSRDEFYKTLDYYCNKIEINNKAYVNKEVYCKYNKGYDIYKNYVLWISGRYNTSVDLYKSHIKASFSNLLSTYNINIETKLLEENEDSNERIKEIASSIGAFKGESSQSADIVDAKNIIYINKLRGTMNRCDIMEIKEFLISNDARLRAWEYGQLKENKRSCVFLPSQWLSIMLRFSSRTTDDLKSFTSFLNMTIQDNSVDVEKLNTVLSCINEITEDVSSQEELAYEILNERVEDIIAIYDDEDLLKDKVKEIATKSLDNKMNDIKEELAFTKRKLADQVDKYSEEINKLKEIVKKQEMNYIKSKVFKWRIKQGIEGSLLIGITILVWILHIFFQDWDKNIIVILYNWAGNEEIKKAVLGVIESLFSLGTVGFGIKKIKSAFDKNAKIYDKISKEYEEYYDDKNGGLCF